MTILAAVGLMREARLIASPGVRPVIGGGRADLLRQRLTAVLAEGAEGIISFGIGGALDPALKVGDIVIGAAVIGAEGRWATDPDWTARLALRLAAARQAPIYGSPVMVRLAREKAALWAQTAAALTDMESHIAAEIAVAHGLPLAVLRVVSDAADADLPAAVLSGMTADGGMNALGVLAALARRPWDLPALIQVGQRTERAFTVLAGAGRVLG